MRQAESRRAARDDRSREAHLAGATRRGLGLCAALACAVLAACASARRPDLDASGGEDAYSAATWRHQATSWEKLDAIETWLFDHGDAAEPELRVEALLELAEGRLELARRDAGSGHGDFLELRLDRAAAGFREVSNHVAASEAQRSRARLGLATVAELLSGGARASALPAVVSRREWGAATPIPARMNRHARTYERITVHHSAVPSSRIGGTSFGSEASAVRQIQRYHMHDPGRLWGDVGYHYLISPSGRVFEGRQLAWQGAHVRDKNPGNLGVCLLGDFTAERPDPAALKSLQELLDGLRAEHHIDRGRVLFHSELARGTTECPGPPLAAWVKTYRR